jgi:hypothetical protein
VNRSWEGQHVALKGERAGQFLDLFNCTLEKTRALVDQHWPAIRRLAKVPMSHQVLSQAAFDALIEGTARERAHHRLR